MNAIEQIVEAALSESDSVDFEYEAATKRVLRGLAEASYQIVPVEPTDAMVKAGQEADWVSMQSGADCEGHWRAMLAAAKEAP